MVIDVGSIVEGKVTGLTKFGAFVSLPEGKSGLVHISEIANQYVAAVADHLHEGQEVKVKVISVDEQGRINLSIKKAEAPPPRPMSRPASRSNQFSGFQGRPAAKEPADFEDKLKQFMQSSDSKLSDIRQQEKRGARRRK